MTLNGVAYSEAKPQVDAEIVCRQCALWAKQSLCARAVLFDAEESFGGDCVKRDVIYVAVPQEPPK